MAQENTSSSQHSCLISAVPVEFPYKPYSSQVSMGHKIICCIQRSQNCILESPTGSGKTLALLCASLAWQKKEYEKLLKEMEERASQQNDERYTPNGDAQVRLNKCNRCKCGQSPSVNEYVKIEKETPRGPSESPEIINICDSDDSDDFQPPKRFRTYSKLEENLKAATPKTPVRNCMCWDTLPDSPFSSPVKKEPSSSRHIPKIYYGTRTHKQITQVIRELRKTVYQDVKMSILGSREVACIHPIVSEQPNKSEECRNRTLTKDPDVKCSYYSRAPHVSIPGAWDIEDLVTVGRKVHACPYYAARELAKAADIIFCPYNYLIDPLVRESMSIDLSGQIVILDEAHNIEDTSRDAASYEVNEKDLLAVLNDLDKIGRRHHHMLAHSFDRLHQMVARLVQWLHRQASALDKQPQSTFVSSSKLFSGTQMVAELNEMSIGPDDLSVLYSCYDAVRRETENPESQVGDKLSGATLMTLSALFLVLEFMFRDSMANVEDYQVAVLNSMSFESSDTQPETPGQWHTSRRVSSPQRVTSLNFWCLNPALAFEAIKSQVRTIVLTSGTLSPMESFQSELKVPFANVLETNHVIPQNQVWVGTLSEGPGRYSLNAVYSNTGKFEYQDEVGDTLLMICRTVPFGVLCFVPSYSLLNKLTERWRATGLWDALESKKRIVLEPRDKRNFDRAIFDFYTAIDDYSEAGERNFPNGALFMAVCRGKASEGLDFADNYARAVVTIGIPFPNFQNLQVKLKREYNSRHSKQRGLLSGNVWYEVQAHRALNQALGRCIRHRNDWGAIIMLDDRFGKSPRTTSYLSKWVRQSVIHHQNFHNAIHSLEQFVKFQKSNPNVQGFPVIPVKPLTPLTGQPAFNGNPDGAVNWARSPGATPELALIPNSTPKRAFDVAPKQGTETRIRRTNVSRPTTILEILEDDST